MRLLEPFGLFAFTLKNRAVLSSAATPRDPWSSGLQMAGLVLANRLVIDDRAPSFASDDTLARALQSNVRQIHATGGRAIAQLWHESGPGRVGLQGHTPGAGATLDRARVERLIERFVDMAMLAQEADFDGVELHVSITVPAASLGQSETYILLEAIEAVGAVLGMTRVGARLSARARHDAVGHVAARQLLFHVAETLDQLGLGWLHLVEPYPCRASVLTGLRRYFGGAILAEGGHTLETAEAVLDQGLADCVVLRPDLLAGRAFIHPAFAIGSCLPGDASAPRSV